jgi:hypothetical protein
MAKYRAANLQNTRWGSDIPRVRIRGRKRNGVALDKGISELLGHESIKTTERHHSKWMKGRQDRLESVA